MKSTRIWKACYAPIATIPTGEMINIYFNSQQIEFEKIQNHIATDRFAKSGPLFFTGTTLVGHLASKEHIWRGGPEGAVQATEKHF